MKGRHTGIWIIHIKLNWFCWEEKLFMGEKRKEHISITGQFFYGKAKLVSYLLKIMLRLCLCKQTNICMSV